MTQKLPELKAEMTEDELERAFHMYNHPGAFQTAAICAFALARLAQMRGNEERAEFFGRKCLAILKECNQQDLADIASPHIKVAGVLIPGLFHEETVRRELSGLSL